MHCAGEFLSIIVSGFCFCFPRSWSGGYDVFGIEWLSVSCDDLVGLLQSTFDLQMHWCLKKHDSCLQINPYFGFSGGRRPGF